MLRDSAQAAVGCDAAAEELVSGELIETGLHPCGTEHPRSCGFQFAALTSRSGLWLPQKR